MAFTKEQLKERCNYLGASEVAGILGLSRWQTALQIWAWKVGEIPYPDEQTLPMWVGTQMEQIVVKRFEHETDKKTHKVNETIFHPDYPFLATHLDRKIVGEDAILEAKTASTFKAREWDQEEIPQEYLIQVYAELAFSGYHKAYLAVLIGNYKFIMREIFYDEHICGNLIKKCVSFWTEFVQPHVMPMQISIKDSDILYQLFPIALPDKEIELGDAVNAMIESLEAMKEDRKSLFGRIGQQENTIKAMLQDAEAGKTSLYRVTWKNEARKEYTVPAKQFRMLRIKKIKEND